MPNKFVQLIVLKTTEAGEGEKYHAGCKNDKSNMEVLLKKWLRKKVILNRERWIGIYTLNFEAYCRYKNSKGGLPEIHPWLQKSVS